MECEEQHRDTGFLKLVELFFKAFMAKKEMNISRMPF